MHRKYWHLSSHARLCVGSVKIKSTACAVKLDLWHHWACISGASSDIREPISLHRSVYQREPHLPHRQGCLSVYSELQTLGSESRRMPYMLSARCGESSHRSPFHGVGSPTKHNTNTTHTNTTHTSMTKAFSIQLEEWKMTSDLLITIAILEPANWVLQNWERVFSSIRDLVQRENTSAEKV